VLITENMITLAFCIYQYRVHITAEKIRKNWGKLAMHQTYAN